MCERVSNYVWQTVATLPSDDRITMLLTAVGVIVAAAGLILVVLSIGLAILAFYGKREIIAAAERKAEKTAKEYIDKFATPEALYSQYLLRNKEAAPQAAVLEDVEPPSELPEVSTEQEEQPVQQPNQQPAIAPVDASQERQGGNAGQDRQDSADDELE
jgi:hypothetical protein